LTKDVRLTIASRPTTARERLRKNVKGLGGAAAAEAAALDGMIRNATENDA
jgi:hypothetical protein